MMEFAVQRWMSVDVDDGDVVREVAALLPATDKPPGIKRHVIALSFFLIFRF